MIHENVSYEPRSSTVVVANAALMVIVGIFVGIRSWVRIFILHSVGLDDIFIWIATTFAFIMAVMFILMAKHGLGYHLDNVSDEELDKFLLFDFVSAISYIWSFVLIKISFALFYLRVIPNKSFRKLNFLMMAILAAQGVEETFVVCFACQPIYKFWTPKAAGTCLNLLKFYYISFGIKFATDIVLFLEPIPTLTRLKLPWVKRLGLIVMFSLGLLTCVISIIRATYLNDTSTDVTWRLVDPIDWSTAEVASLIICACIPYVRNLLAEIPYISEALGLSSNHSKGRSYASHSGYPARSRRSDHDNSIALQSQRTYIQSRNLKTAHGTTSAAATATADASKGRIRATESQEEIFPHYTDRQGGIIVSTDVKVAVESSQSRSSFSA
ncbi:integral membrane protein [Ophiostoma piceae UAMH 11346]|uniref:Integral membrane protein n=1 Tax=Ophiostoma piceae (strain UAMH 11346) TaxID=1262450 RepID=S3C8P6_OPHP1|nr:integral membrane protein [Ophiostoma piceae UAMH 11346]